MSADNAPSSNGSGASNGAGLSNVSVIASDTVVPAPAPATNSYGEVGAGVGAILAAAEQAAEEILSSARTKAAHLIHEAEEAVAARIQDLTRQGEDVRNAAEAEAREMRRAGETYGENLRREADEKATDIVERTERRAREVLAEAEHRAKALETQLSSRQQELQNEVQRLEAQHDRVVRGLRTLASQIAQIAQAAPVVDSHASTATEQQPVAEEPHEDLEPALDIRRGNRRRLVR